MHDHFVALFYSGNSITNIFDDAAPFMPQKMRNEFCIAFIAHNLLQLRSTKTTDENLNQNLPERKWCQFNLGDHQRSVYRLEYRGFHKP